MPRREPRRGLQLSLLLLLGMGLSRLAVAELYFYNTQEPPVRIVNIPTPVIRITPPKPISSEPDLARSSPLRVSVPVLRLTAIRLRPELRAKRQYEIDTMPLRLGGQ